MMLSMSQILVPTLGFLHSHAWDSGIGKLSRMKPREILAANLKRLKDARPDLGTLKKITDRSNGRLSNGKLGRIVAASHTTDIDTLADLAQVFGLEPWHLLVEDLDLRALPAADSSALIKKIESLVNGKGIPPAYIPAPRGKNVTTPAIQRTLMVKGKHDASGLPQPIQKPRGRKSS